MGCPSEVIIGRNLTFSMYSHDPDTGEITAASSAPSYWIEDEDGTAILSGTMDSGTRTGSYKKKIAVTTANGFANGKSYTIYVEATVDGDAGGIAYDFIALAAQSATGEGTYTGTLTINDGSTGLEGAKVHARRGGVLIATGTTDSNGQITDFVFDANTYSLAVSLGGYDTATDTITVSGNAWAKTISLTAFAISPPDDVSLCTVQFRVKLGNTAVQGAICKATLQGTNVAADGTVLSKTAVTDTTDGDGVAELQLVRSDVIVKGSKLYGIQVTYNGVTMASKLCEIPAQSTVLFEDLL